MMTRREALVAAGAAFTVAAGSGEASASEKGRPRADAASVPLDCPNRLGQQLMEVFGLGGKRIKSIDIRCHAFEPVTVTTVEYADEEQGDAVVEVLREYELRLPGQKQEGGET